MNFTINILIFLLINLIFLKPLFADEKKFMCVTENFTNTAGIFNPEKKDKEFENRQMNKKYLLTITKKNIFLTDTNIKNKNSQETYTIIYRVTNTHDIMSVKVNPIGVYSLVFNTKKKIGTKILQGSFFTYVSYLKCS